MLSQTEGNYRRSFRPILEEHPNEVTMGDSLTRGGGPFRDIRTMITQGDRSTNRRPIGFENTADPVPFQSNIERMESDEVEIRSEEIQDNRDTQADEGEQEEDIENVRDSGSSSPDRGPPAVLDGQTPITIYLIKP